MNHIKRLWGHYLALVITTVILSMPIRWTYRFFLDSFGQESALVALTLTVMAAVVLSIRGAVHTHRIIKGLRKKTITPHPTPQDEVSTPLIFKVFKIELTNSRHLQIDKQIEPNKAETPHYQFPTFPKKRRGKQPRFPEEKIRKAVLKWESRDPSFLVLTLEEFLAQEFGCSPDGILLMATTTFYDWRRRILKEIESHKTPP